MKIGLLVVSVIGFERDLHHLGKRFALTGVLARDTRQGLSSKGVSVGHC